MVSTTVEGRSMAFVIRDQVFASAPWATPVLDAKSAPLPTLRWGIFVIPRVSIISMGVDV